MMIKMAMYDRIETTNQLKDLIDPQVLAEFLDAKLKAAIKFAPLCNINNELVGRPGSKLTLPQWTYIGDAIEFGEGEAVDFGQLGYDTIEATIKKAGKGVN